MQRWRLRTRRVRDPRRGGAAWRLPRPTSHHLIRTPYDSKGPRDTAPTQPVYRHAQGCCTRVDDRPAAAHVAAAARPRSAPCTVACCVALAPPQLKAAATSYRCPRWRSWSAQASAASPAPCACWRRAGPCTSWRVSDRRRRCRLARVQSGSSRRCVPSASQPRPPALLMRALLRHVSSVQD